MKTYALQLTLEELKLLYISLSNRPLVTTEVMEQIQITIDLAKCDEKIKNNLSIDTKALRKTFAGYEDKLESKTFTIAGKYNETIYGY